LTAGGRENKRSLKTLLEGEERGKKIIAPQRFKDAIHGEEGERDKYRLIHAKKGEGEIYKQKIHQSLGKKNGFEGKKKRASPGHSSRLSLSSKALRNQKITKED